MYISNPTAAISPDCSSAEDVAAAADLEVAGGDAEAGAEVGELLDGGEPLARVAGEDAVGGYEQIAEGEPVAAPDAPAELVELREAETLRVIDQDRVAAGMSIPFSMIVVARSTSYSRAMKRIIASSSSFSSICPWPTITRRPGTSRSR